MDLTHEVSNGLLVIRPKGRIDSDTAADFETRCASLIAKGPAKTIVDFSQVAYISSAGLRALLVAAKQAKSLGGALTLCALNGGVSELDESLLRFGPELFSLVGVRHETFPAILCPDLCPKGELVSGHSRGTDFDLWPRVAD